MPSMTVARPVSLLEVLTTVACLSLSSCSDPNAVPTPTHLAFATQPSAAVAGAALTPALQIRILDADGNLVSASTAQVALSLAANPSGATVAGTTTVSAVAGVATFTDISLATSGAGYTLQAASAGLTPDTSVAFSITPGTLAALTVLGGNLQSGVVGRTLPDTLRVRAVDEHSNPIQGVPIVWSVLAAGGALVTSEAVTDASGIARATWRLGSASGPHQVTAGSASLVAQFSSTALALRIVSIRNVGPSSFEFVRLDTETGTSLLSVPRPELTGTVQGHMSTDPLTGRYFVSNGVLFTISAASGSILASPDLSAVGVNDIQYDPATESIVGLTSRTGTHEFVRVNPQTGAITSVAFLSSTLGFNQGSAGFDISTGRYFILAVDSAFTERLYSISAATGQLLSSPDVSPLSLSGTRFDPSTGMLVGLTFRTGVEELVRVSPTTGAVTSIGYIPEIQTITQGEAALDNASRRYVFLASDGPTERLYVLSLETAAVIARQPITGLRYPQVAP